MNSPHPMVAEGDLFKVHTKKYYWYECHERTSACMEPGDFVLVLKSITTDGLCTVIHNGQKMYIDKLTLWQIARLEKP